MGLWTDLITPAELTGFARAAQEDIERQKGTLARWLPNYATADVVVRTIVSEDGTGALAQYRAFDAETPIGSGGKGQRKTFELLPLGLKERVGEYDQLRMRGNAAEAMVLGGVKNAAKRVVNAVVDRLELARGQALDTGALTINENGVVQTMAFGRPAGNTVTAATLWSGAAPVLSDLIAWCDAYAAVNNGAYPGAIATSKRVVAAMQRNADIRGLVATTGGTPGIVSIEALNAVLAAYGLPPIVIYDRKIRGQNVLPDNKVYLLPPAGPTTIQNPDDSALGATFSGPTLEASESEYGIALADQPGLVVGSWKTKDPIGVWVHSNAISMPVLVNPVASMVATVL
ncbi:major capsid protein E [Mycobacterium sp. CBMA293]|uniref:major capsid protein n=1 Tax=unclassified Mycolicibacterium TaxID=2636767 RepID=UPI0012DFE53C|nr:MULTISPECIES: major capsid protein [unclassified Mycolicibacterium]MUL47600.1 major capsid protein E [Mycolicibacterium sp. CBMA 360]MUL61882.1 major capsid protein E [Mycolicibacterium sp. CBMA 335]MUL68955.1 major capsid protein E [Mycolicibacterium sp. CBMA 311]MUL92828.1 major capsid protein E [Mycolicibacterium sp. CBMA 230]MUM08730.1 hypothetical protein [Mycolicibacterium sp. CBMA 213]